MDRSLCDQHHFNTATYTDEDASAAADFDDDDNSMSLPLKPSDFTSGTFSWGREASHRESPLITFHTIQPSLNLFLSYPTLSYFTFHTSHFQVLILSHFTFHACFLTPFATLLDVMPLHFFKSSLFFIDICIRQITPIFNAF